MKENFAKSLNLILKHEGGFVNHPRDPGGMTNLGVTRETWENWLKRPVSESEMRALTKEVIAPLYRIKYWNAVRGDDLPAGLDYAVFDMAVNSGPSRAIKTLQKVLRITQDGVIGPVTINKSTSIDASQLIDDFNQERLKFLQSLPTWDTFGKGWGRRVVAITTEAVNMTV